MIVNGNMDFSFFEFWILLVFLIIKTMPIHQCSVLSARMLFYYEEVVSYNTLLDKVSYNVGQTFFLFRLFFPNANTESLVLFLFQEKTCSIDRKICSPCRRMRGRLIGRYIGHGHGGQ